MRMPSWIVAGALLASLGGCAALTARPLSEAGARNALTVGLSTRADAARIFGLAHVVSFSSGYEVWIYSDKRHVPSASSPPSAWQLLWPARSNMNTNW